MEIRQWELGADPNEISNIQRNKIPAAIEKIPEQKE
jgi:hypothetical protein